MYLTKFRTYKIALPPQTKPRGGRGPQTPAAKSLYWSIFKKSRHLGFGVFIDKWSMCGMVQVAYDKDKTYGSKSYSVRRDVKQIQLELMNNGPVEAAFTVFEVIELMTNSGPKKYDQRDKVLILYIGRPRIYTDYAHGNSQMLTRCTQAGGQTAGRIRATFTSYV